MLNISEFTSCFYEQSAYKKLKQQETKLKQNNRKQQGLQNGTIRGLQIGAGFRDYKSGQEGLQIGTA